MRVAGIDYSTKAVDIVTVDMDGNAAPDWHRFPLKGDDAFNRTRHVSFAMRARASMFWDEILAVGIEHPGGKHGTGPMLRVQGAVLAQIPARILVQPLPPGRWRKLVGLSGKATKEEVALKSWMLLLPHEPGEDDWAQDAHDADLIAHATLNLLNQQEAA